MKKKTKKSEVCARPTKADVRGALDVVYAYVASSKQAQRFAKDHPGRKLFMDAGVEIGVIGQPCCMLAGFPGYVLKSEKL